MADSLIIYFSRRGQNYFRNGIREVVQGNTSYCVQYIQRAVGSDVFEVEPDPPYSERYAACVQEARDESLTGERRACRQPLSSLDGYRTVFVCGPCWWNSFPGVLLGQLEQLTWRGKHVFPLITHEGSGFGRGEKDLRMSCKGAMLGEGLAILGGEVRGSEGVVAAWARRCVEQAKSRRKAAAGQGGTYEL